MFANFTRKPLQLAEHSLSLALRDIRTIGVSPILNAPLQPLFSLNQIFI